ncbi:MAG: DUF3419 family protein [Bacteroidales bacterium]|nr:DUF3419 family protein [Bacteroidales bacterium]
MPDHLKNVKHNYIRYANCWEDADILTEALQIKPADKVLSIGGAGDNSFSLLAFQPAVVIAADINKVQLNLIELKKAAFIALDYQEFIEFLGFAPCASRQSLFLKTARFLPPHVLPYWTARKQEIDNGIIFHGKFERYFKIFREKILPFIHSQKNVNRLFQQKEALEQQLFFNKKWNNARWRLLFKIFFSRAVMGRLGRDPRFMDEVSIPVADFISRQAKNHLSTVRCQQNYFLQFILTGKFNTSLPHYAREQNFLQIKSAIDRISTFHGMVEDVFNEHGGFNKFNLSNIFEYMSPAMFAAVSRQLVINSAAESVFAYWNLMVPRHMWAIDPALRHDESKSNEINKKRQRFFL